MPRSAGSARVAPSEEQQDAHARKLIISLEYNNYCHYRCSAAGIMQDKVAMNFNAARKLCYFSHRNM